MTRIPTKLKPWFEARRRFKLSHAHTQMARELGMNPRKLGSLAGGGQEPWKLSRSLSSNATAKALADQSQSMCDLWKKWYRLKRSGAKRSKHARPRRWSFRQDSPNRRFQPMVLPPLCAGRSVAEPWR